MKKQDEPNKSDAGALVPVSQVKEISSAEFLRSAKALLANRKLKEAFTVLQQAHIKHPGNPYIASYYGYLQAVVDKRYRSGVETCKSALVLLRKQAVSGREVQYGVVYLNLGRAYIAAGKKKDAIETFQQGLKYDGRNSELLKELQALGKRKKPFLPFLERSNTLNKCLGMILNKTTT